MRHAEHSHDHDSGENDDLNLEHQEAAPENHNPRDGQKAQLVENGVGEGPPAPDFEVQVLVHTPAPLFRPRLVKPFLAVLQEKAHRHKLNHAHSQGTDCDPEGGIDLQVPIVHFPHIEQPYYKDHKERAVNERVD